MTKRVIVELKDAGGNPVAGAKVKATDCWELDSSEQGLAVFLIDVDDFTIEVDGKPAYSGKLASVGDKVVLVMDGGGWKAG